MATPDPPRVATTASATPGGHTAQAGQSVLVSQVSRPFPAAPGRRQEARPQAAVQGSPPPAPGLVLSRKTARVVPSTLAGLDDAVVSPTLADVVLAARSFGPSSWTSLAEDSPLPRLVITPGALILTRTSSRQVVRTGELAQARRVGSANAAALFLAFTDPDRGSPANPDWHAKGTPGREVTGWSAQSRVNMVRVLASLDWGPVHELAKAGRVLAMVTVTYPGDWEAVAPDGKTVKAHLRAWKERYRRAWGEPIVGAWKLEFQGRGAPHFHMLMAPPHGHARGRGAGAGLAFRHWLSVVWADIVDCKDPVEYQKHLAAGTGVDYATALKCSDPKRLAVYFGKHGQWASKEYQHIVPEPWREPGKGPGRFWGRWGLDVLAVAAELTEDDRMLAARILRRHAERVRIWDEAGQRFRYVRAMSPGKGRWRDADPVTGEVIWRKRRRRTRVRRFTSCAGFLVVNDAPRLAHDLARALEVCGGDRPCQ